MSEETPWYEKAFSALYTELYGHRSPEEAERAIDLLARHVDLAGKRILDLACGAGRYLAALAGRRASPVGVDLSADLLTLAKERGVVVRGDMRRIPCRYGAFDGVASMFTSFGYFDSREENIAVFREIAPLLAPGGWFFFDYLHAARVVENLVARSERKAGSRHIVEERCYDAPSARLTKKITVSDRSGNDLRWEERLLLFTPDEIETALETAGFLVERRFGDYEGDPFTPMSERLIVLSRVRP